MTWLRGNVSVREEQATAALEVMSRFALDPRWVGVSLAHHIPV